MIARILSWLDKRRGLMPKARGKALDRLADLYGVPRRGWWEFDGALRKRILAASRSVGGEQ